MGILSEERRLRRIQPVFVVREEGGYEASIFGVRFGGFYNKIRLPKATAIRIGYFEFSGLEGVIEGKRVSPCTFRIRYR